MSEIEAKFSKVPSKFAPIEALARKFSDQESFTVEDGVYLFGNESERGPRACAVTLFPGLQEKVISRYEELHDIHIPEPIRAFLGHFNGAILCEMSIYGIPPSMIDDPALLSRSVRNPLDIGTAAKIWRVGFPSAKETEFHFGSRNIGWSSQIGYFFRYDGSVAAYSRYKKADGAVNTWPTFEDWLRDEIDAMVQHRPLFLEECRLGNLRANRRYFFEKLLPWNWHLWFRG